MKLRHGGGIAVIRGHGCMRRRRPALAVTGKRKEGDMPGQSSSSMREILHQRLNTSAHL